MKRERSSICTGPAPVAHTNDLICTRVDGLLIISGHRIKDLFKAEEVPLTLRKLQRDY